MLKNESKRAGRKAFLGIVILLAGIVVLENLNLWLPSVPSILLPTSQLFVVLKKAAVYSLVAVSMNLLNGFTGLFSLGQAGFMLLGAYTYAILTVPLSVKDQVYYLYGGSAVKFSLPDLFWGIFGSSGAGYAIGLVLAVFIALILAGLVAAGFAYLIGLPVLRLKSDYLAIATLGFAEILRAIFQWQKLGPVTNGANMIKSFPIFSSFNYRFDGVVYAVFVSLGFAAFENILYVFRYGLSVALPRALLAIPGHMGFAVFMGCFYGRAKLCESYGDEGGKTINLILGWLSATVLHGIYDSCAMIGSGASTVVFVVFVVLMYIVVLRRVDRESRTDHPL